MDARLLRQLRAITAILAVIAATEVLQFALSSTITTSIWFTTVLLAGTTLAVGLLSVAAHQGVRALSPPDPEALS